MADDARDTEDTQDVAGGADPTTPSKAEPIPADATATSAPAASDEDGGKIDPQLIGLAVVLWLLAVGIFAFKWDRLRVDWYLGNIKETGDLTGRLDEGSITSLAALAAADPEVLRMVGDEAVGPLANRDEFYRSAIVKTIERVPGPAAQELLLAAATDFHGVVRANAYVSLGERVKREPSERERALPALLGAALGEPEPMARAFALSILGDIGAKEALWPAIRAVRDARGAAGSANAEAAAQGELALREMGAKTFYALSGTTKEQLPFDPAGELATRDAQVRAWEAWFEKNGGKIPDGDRFEDLHPQQPADAQGPRAAGDGQSTQAPPPTEASGEGSQGAGQQGSQ